MGTVIKNIPIDFLEINEGQLSKIDKETNKQVGLPRNPRWIRDARFAALKKSIEDAPEMLDLRELIVYSLSEIKGKDGKYIVIAGNMRLRACQELGYAELPCKVLDPVTPMEKLREYAIKDNIAFGQDEYDILADEWEGEELHEWGMELSYLDKSDTNLDDFFEEKAQSDSEQTSVQCTITVTFDKENESQRDDVYDAIRNVLSKFDFDINVA